VGVDGQAPAQLEVAAPHEVLGLAAPAEAELLELHQHEGREVVVEDGGLDVAGADPRRLVELARHQAHLGQARDVLSVVARHHLLVVAGALGGGPDHGGELAQAARPLEARHHHRHRAVALLAAVQQAQRLLDPAGILVLLQGDGLPVEPGRGVRGRVPAVRHRDVAEGLAGGAELVEVALGEHGHPGGGRQQAEGRVPAEVGALGGGRGGPALHAGAEAVRGALVHGPVADHHLGHARGHGHGRLQDRRAGRAASVVDAAEEGELAPAEAALHLDLGIVVHGEGGHPVDVAGREAGVVEGGLHRLHRQAQLAAPGVLGELRGANPGNGGPIPQPAGHRAHPPPGSATRTVPVTWSPRLFAPRTSTSTRPSPPSRLFATTRPERVMVSWG